MKKLNLSKKEIITIGSVEEALKEEGLMVASTKAIFLSIVFTGLFGMVLGFILGLLI